MLLRCQRLDMVSSSRSHLKRYGLALIATLMAIYLTQATLLRIGAPFLLLVLAILLATWYGGFGPGLLAVALSTVGAIDFLMPPFGSFSLEEGSDIMRLSIFVLVGLISCGITAERDRARKSAESHARQQAAVAQLGEAALARADTRSVIDQAPALLAQVLRVDYSYVLELLPDGESLRLIAGSGWKDGAIGNTILSRRTLSQTNYTFISQMPVIVEDLQKETRFAAPPFLREHQVVSGMTVLILGPGKPFGILGAFTKHRRPFTQDDIHFMQSIANVLATAIQHQQAEDALHEREKAYRALADNSPDGIHRYDRELRHLYVNPAVERVSGMPAQDIIGRTGTEVGVPEPQWSIWAAAIKDVFATCQEKRVELHLASRRGTRYLESHLVPEFAKDNQVQSVLVVTRDITDRKRAEQALWESKELLETMFSSIDLMIAYMDRDFNFIRVNRAYAAADHHEPEFYVGKNHFALFPNAENEALFRRVVDTGEPYSVYAKPFEYAEHPERGTSYWDWTVQPTKDPDGCVTGVVLSLIDVSERVLAQQAVEHASERRRDLAREMILLQEEDRERLSNTLHNDTAQVMAATLLSLQTVSADLPTVLTPLRERLGRTSEELCKALADIRALAGDLHPPALDTLGPERALAGLCQNVARRSRMLVEYAGTDLVGLSHTNAIFLYRFVQEGLSNAALHSQAKRVQVSLRKDNGNIIATVQDDGVGFDQATALHGLQGRRGSGLDATRERLELLGGRLEIHSHPGEGTLLRAEIPLS